ncbi:iron-containing alcohol dehydrogenase [Chromobacterium paludis]|uniref:Iron-containing alcohol dehydrogenase n=1 Tax=Chromobacterium paludis TaxID=2605945 RepID=A0A5C1DHD3_9NEIS|nr:iron-containing alcohol dehydrogenase [Chromobacterium paludis]QEL55993.1 iron-containing alcohol dehydrogenase [Chromobacterium paludis]
MKRKLWIAALGLLAAQTTLAQSVTPQEIGSGQLVGEKQVSLYRQTDDALPQVSFNTTGYTLIGMLYVAAAVAKMKSQSSSLQEAYHNYLKSHPEQPSLQQAFRDKVAQDLKTAGIEVANFDEVQAETTDKAVIYHVDAAKLSSHKLVVLDKLGSAYFAPSSTDPYKPRAQVLVTVFDRDHPDAQPLQFMRVASGVPDDSPYVFKDYEALSKDTGQAYAGLRASAETLADELVRSLTQPLATASAAP